MKKRILLVDDEEMTHMNFKKRFENTGYELDFASNSIEGLDKIKRNNYDLIILDIFMPDLNNRQSDNAGVELLKIITELKPGLPVIMNTVIKKVEVASEAIRLGAKAFLIKNSISTEELMARIEDATRTLEKIISCGESARLEFKSSLRWDFKENKIDKKTIGCAWLTTIVAFLNTEGGTLLIGVADDGCILGIEADKFPNEDKYLLHFSNLVNQHIGPEFSQFVNAELIPINSKKVLHVQCEKSKKPVFLRKNKDEEDFYIRVGPSSRKLSIRETLEYLGNKKD